MTIQISDSRAQVEGGDKNRKLSHCLRPAVFDRPDLLSTEDDTMGGTRLTFVKCTDHKRVAVEKYFNFSLGAFISSCLFFHPGTKTERLIGCLFF